MTYRQAHADGRHAKVEPDGCTVTGRALDPDTVICTGHHGEQPPRLPCLPASCHGHLSASASSPVPSALSPVSSPAPSSPYCRQVTYSPPIPGCSLEPVPSDMLEGVKLTGGFLRLLLLLLLLATQVTSSPEPSHHYLVSSSPTLRRKRSPLPASLSSCFYFSRFFLPIVSYPSFSART